MLYTIMTAAIYRIIIIKKDVFHIFINALN